jgi:hypothetical protein
MQIKRVSDGGDDGDSYMHDILIFKKRKSTKPNCAIHDDAKTHCGDDHF